MASCHISIRSIAPDVVSAVQSAPQAWLHGLAGGTLQLCMGASGEQTAHIAGQAGPQPPLHPRVAALHSAAHIATPASMGMLRAGSAGLPGGTMDVWAQGALAGTKVSHKWMASVALAEWQRLAAH
eukprot:CAMPEP_0119113654 /NCGR_PEP_ID=MMETSP1180-20130426/44754_1 /TAXON_ID=3052 ORGANISM="Chlamydomonas cf sp, Strain CCMP681" /NCGR_SAMPLE_ID=MMETSP1180 /ASSEMBLY_ACC=CAM_ASM_000741 /LENGTH=125 /DNA_ID=CAMNT_0007101853 /DNA_START=14 /DNA_END=391 /DNA_ORIENTATION=+